MPSYQGKVTFVNAITGDASGAQLASQFKSPYIPTSYFVGADGAVIDSFIGPLMEGDMRARLDALLAR